MEAYLSASLFSLFASDVKTTCFSPIFIVALLLLFLLFFFFLFLVF